MKLELHRDAMTTNAYASDQGSLAPDIDLMNKQTASLIRFRNEELPPTPIGAITSKSSWSSSTKTAASLPRATNSRRLIYFE